MAQKGKKITKPQQRVVPSDYSEILAWVIFNRFFVDSTGEAGSSRNSLRNRRGLGWKRRNRLPSGKDFLRLSKPIQWGPAVKWGRLCIYCRCSTTKKLTENHAIALQFKVKALSVSLDFSLGLIDLNNTPENLGLDQFHKQTKVRLF